MKHTLLDNPCSSSLAGGQGGRQPPFLSISRSDQRCLLYPAACTLFKRVSLLLQLRTLQHRTLHSNDRSRDTVPTLIVRRS